MKQFKNKLLKTSFFVAAAISATFVGGFSYAQDAKQSEEKPKVEEKKNTASEVVVITGSRIRRDEFNSSSPIEVITRDEAILAGTATTTEVLQSSAVTSGSSQVNNAFLGFVTEGGPGANTVSLRGLGAVRTLVLLNGRRLAPAGTRGQVAPADINTLPSSIVSRIEVLKDGASSVYGSDAVAGVVNIITRRGINDTTLEAFTDQTFDGGAEQYSASLVTGKTGDNFQVSGSLEYNETKALLVGDRDWSRCPTDNRYNPVTRAFLGVANLDGTPRCFPIGVTGGGGIAQDYMVVSGFFGSPRRYNVDPATVAGGGNLNGYKRVDALALRPQANPGQLEDDIYSPVKTYNAYLNGSYDLRALGNAELYGEFMYSHRESESNSSRQLSLDPLGAEPLGYHYGISSFGYPDDNPFFPTALAAIGAYAINPLIYWGRSKTSSEVDYYRTSVGIKGDLPYKNWKYDLNLLHSKSTGAYTFGSFNKAHLYQSFDLVVAPTGTPANLVVAAPTGTVGAGNSYTCRVNVTNPNAGCIPANLLTDAAMSGNIPADLRAWLFGDISGDTDYTQTTAQLALDGDLFTLPAGKVSAAVGLEFRWDDLNDTPPIEMQNGNAYNLTKSGITKGKDHVSEAFAEIDAPLLANKPLIKELKANLSGRFTDYDSYGSSSTYKLGLNWTPVSTIKVRGTVGTSFRAPGIFEQKLGGQSGFYSSAVDPCNEFENELPTSNLYKNCAAALTAATGAPVTDWLAFAGPEVFQVGGDLAKQLGLTDGLKAEKSKASTLGIVWQPELTGRSFSFATDWWRIEVNDQVDNFGTSILSLCYNESTAVFNAKGGFCGLVDDRDGNGNLTKFRDPYTNVAAQAAEGLDFNMRYKQDVGTGTLRVTARATWMFEQSFQLSADDDVDNAVGRTRYPEVTGDLTVNYQWKDWTFNYFLEAVSAMNSNIVFGLGDDNASGYQFKTELYTLHSISARYESPKKWSATVGINNIFNEDPPSISSGASSAYTYRIGNSLNYSGYDYRGRSLFARFSKTF